MTLAHNKNSISIDIIYAIPNYVVSGNRRNNIKHGLSYAFVNWMVASGEKSAENFNKSCVIHN